MEKSVLVAAIDFSEDYSQISYFDGLMREPESFSTLYDEKRYLIPSMLWFDDNSKRVCFGDEAVRCEKTGKGTVVKNMISGFYAGEKVDINGQTYEMDSVIERYISSLISLFKGNAGKGNPKCVVFTIETLDEKMISLLYRIMENQGYEREQISVVSHSESFLYYGLSREKELFANEVVMFDYNKSYFKYRRFMVEKNRHPQIIDMVERDFTDDFPYEYMESDEGKAKADKLLTDFVQNEFRTHVVSTVYLTGTGFYEDWMKQSLNYICSRRRVFKGYNLYVKGACYRAMEKAGYVQYKDMIFKCYGRTWADIKLMVNRNEKTDEITLSKAGTGWYEAGAKAECITDGDKNIGFIIESPVSGISKGITIDIGSFPKRPPKTTRVEITVRYSDMDKCVISVEDKGFGDFYKASGRIVSYTVDMKEYL